MRLYQPGLTPSADYGITFRLTHWEGMGRNVGNLSCLVCLYFVDASCKPCVDIASVAMPPKDHADMGIDHE